MESIKENYGKIDSSQIKTKLMQEKNRVGDTEKYYILLNEHGEVEEDIHGYPIRHGLFTSWNINGIKIEEGEYAFNNKVGKWISYYKNGSKKTEILYGKDGEKEGTATYWNEDGRIVSKQEYRRGKLLITKDFDSNGQRIKNKPGDIKIRFFYADIYFGYPSGVSDRFAFLLTLPSTIYCLENNPIILGIMTEPGIGGISSGIGMSRSFIRISGLFRYSWYEINWSKFPHQQQKSIYAGGELELTSGLLSIKGGPSFNLRSNFRKNYYISLQIGFNIGYFIELINTME